MESLLAQELGTARETPRTLKSDSFDFEDSTMKRRQFLGAAVGGAAALGSDLSGLAQGAVAPVARRIPIGFLGAVHSHGLPKLRLASKSPDWEVVGVAEQDAATRMACEKLGVPLLNQAEVIERSEVITVESAVPDHARHALLALKAGRHVHVEKPPAETLEEMREMIRLAQQARRVFQPGYMWRNNPAFQKIFEAARAGWLGSIYSIRAHMSNAASPGQRREWGQFKGGSMFELGVHMLDPIARLLGKPVKVTPFLRTDHPVQDAFRDNNVAVLEFERGVAVLLNNSLQSSRLPVRSFEVLGTGGSASIRPIEPPVLEIDLAQAAGPYQAGPQSVPLPRYERYVDDLAELARAVRGERPLGVTLEEESLVQEVILMACGMAT